MICKFDFDLDQLSYASIVKSWILQTEVDRRLAIAEHSRACEDESTKRGLF